MISEAELRRWAGTWSADPMVVDLDYVLGCFLSQWYQDKKSTRLRFKGGTCLRKCYFPDYRFSEDLDFTAEAHLTRNMLQSLLTRTTQRLQDVFGLDFAVRPPRVEVVNDEYGSESFQIRLYYRGPLRWRGDPRAIRLDISRGEYIGLPVVRREIIHPYGDRDLLSGITIPCYALEEMLAEKLRAISGQRRFAIARDLFDIYQLISKGGVSLNAVKPLLAGKFKAKKIALGEHSLENLLARRNEFERDWMRNLYHLLPTSESISFASAWETGVNAIRSIVQKP
ncbi:MAG: nucleotidyl transferase AbiEii/AbiGii toxin family protein [Chloroflexi bacterium]|nr:nucleotidyl transferase AbiEii/AbiGii toxin family protein [Chloroflexota bacterium]